MLGSSKVDFISLCSPLSHSKKKLTITVSQSTRNILLNRNNQFSCFWNRIKTITCRTSSHRWFRFFNCALSNGYCFSCSCLGCLWLSCCHSHLGLGWGCFTARHLNGLLVLYSQYRFWCCWWWGSSFAFSSFSFSGSLESIKLILGDACQFHSTVIFEGQHPLLQDTTITRQNIFEVQLGHYQGFEHLPHARCK